MAAVKLIRIYPTATAYVPGVPAVIQDVTPDRADELLAYRPPAFTLTPPAPAPAPIEPEAAPASAIPEV